MTLKYPIGLFRVLRCDGQDPDGQDCTWIFDGHAGDLVPVVRTRARQHGWVCDNPGPRRPARDLCPRHRSTVQRPGAS